jgi:hypothetical protein
MWNGEPDIELNSLTAMLRVYAVAESFAIVIIIHSFPFAIGLLIA